MAKIQVQKPVVSASSSADRLKDTISTFCYYFPRYSFDEAMKLQIKTVKRMLRAARREQAKEHIQMLKIAKVARSTKVAPIKKLLDEYKKEAQ